MPPPSSEPSRRPTLPASPLCLLRRSRFHRPTLRFQKLFPLSTWRPIPSSNRPKILSERALPRNLPNRRLPLPILRPRRLRQILNLKSVASFSESIPSTCSRTTGNHRLTRLPRPWSHPPQRRGRMGLPKWTWGVALNQGTFRVTHIFRRRSPAQEIAPQRSNRLLKACNRNRRDISAKRCSPIGARCNSTRLFTTRSTILVWPPRRAAIWLWH